MHLRKMISSFTSNGQGVVGKSYEILGCSLDKSVDFVNFAAVNNLTIIFYTMLTKI